MKELTGQYKKDEDSLRFVRLAIFNEDAESFSGVDFTRLSDDEAIELRTILIEYQNKLKPFMKGYRSFKKNKFKDDVKINNHME